MKSLSGEEIHIWKHKLGNRALFIFLFFGFFFSSPSLMSGPNNLDRFRQEIGPIYVSAFILLPAPCSFEAAMKKNILSTWLCVEVCFLYE